VTRDEAAVRRAAIQDRLRAEKLQALLVTSPVNVRYLTGFTGSNSLLLLTQDAARLFTDPRYTSQSAVEASCAISIAKKGPLLNEAIARIRKAKIRKLGFEKGHISYESHAKLTEELPKTVKYTAVDGWVEEARLVKSATEIERIQESVVTNSLAFDRALRRLRPKMTESELAAELDYQQRKLGAEGTAFNTIVAAGPQSALPHAHPRHEPIGLNRLLLVDMGAQQRGYMSDMTRTMVVGKATHRMRHLYGAVLEAQLAAIDAVRPGVRCAEIDRRARITLKRHGLEKQFIHSTGHGLGLEIHEPPRLGRTEVRVLAPGMVITIEPGVYLPGEGGIRIEDTVLVTETGCDVLTPTPKDLLVI
jgi:Xaa-Pro aminopeptidase